MNDTELMKSIKKIKQDVSKLNTKINNHLGDIGSDVHGLPANGEPGFIPYSLYNSSNSLFTKRINVTSETSIDKLEPGFYSFVGNKISGIPETIEQAELMTLDVARYNDSKQYRLWECWKNRIWTKTDHVPTASNPESRSTGWMQETTGVTIWGGLLSSGSSTMTANFDAYERLEIIYRTPQLNRFSTVVDRTPTVSLYGGNIPDTGTGGVLNCEMGLSFSGKTVTITKNIAAFGSGGENVTSDPNYTMVLTRISGRNA